MPLKPISHTSSKPIRELFLFDFAIALSDDYTGSSFTVTGGVDIGLPTDFSHAYIACKYLQTDALIKEFTLTQRAQYWPDGWTLLHQQPGIVSLCLDHDIKADCIHGATPRSLTKQGSPFYFSGPSMTWDRRTAALLDMFVPHLHLSFSQLSHTPPADGRAVSITSREKEVLNGLKHGKRSWDISMLLGISERTVNHHLYNIMEKLEVVNRPQAVAAALHLGLIELC